VAVSAGFCEELVFRGYFQRQFLALTGSAGAAVALQALVFGVGHSYEGAWAVAKITAYGILFGLLAAWRRSLRPGMLRMRGRTSSRGTLNTDLAISPQRHKGTEKIFVSRKNKTLCLCASVVR
jgi:hypothetical protein